MKWVILFIAIVSNASASGLLKMATNEPFIFPSIKDPIAAFYNWPFWLGLFSYGVSFLFYALALSRMPLNIAYPTLIAGTTTSICLISLFFFGEKFYWTTIIGIALVIVGVFLIAIK